ncbi:hypothetical protein [Paenibacillus cremeus]|uniref:Uncharacterized protein n=1 Tax=Paenibacillus cremeus TaxID=2163881 RepID=A0A559KCJ9_9BACL|nr:hypothetical protein [Paenibacillus cremeus]TVY09845.1 hypothetical protein FPZ49_10755 [Paenibacillus cremeus]
MQKLYAIAQTQTGKSVVIDNLSDFYPTALRQAQEQCAKQDLIFQGIRPVGNVEKKESTMQKRFSSGLPTPRSGKGKR